MRRMTTVGLIATLVISLLTAPNGQAQSVDVLVLDAGSLVSVAFDVPVSVFVPWPAAMAHDLSGVDFQRVERDLRVYRASSRTRPSLSRFDSGDDVAWEPTEATAQADSTGLHIVLDRMRPNRFYRYRFVMQRNLTAREDAAFRGAAVEALDHLFREPLAGTLNQDRRRRMQQTMMGAIRSVTTAEVHAKPGSLFDDSIRDGDVSESDPFNAVYVKLRDLAVLSNPANRAANAAALDARRRGTGELQAARTALERLVGRTLVDMHLLVSELRIEERRTGISGSELVDSLQLLSEAAYRLGTLDRETAAALAGGEIALSRFGVLSDPLPAVDDVWTAADLSRRRACLETTAATLGRLTYLVDQVTHLAEYRETSQGRTITDAELAQMRVRLVAARDALRGVPVRDRAYLALEADLSRRTEILRSFVEEAAVRMVEADVYASATTTAAFRTRASTYVSADIGLAHAPALDIYAPYFGVNVYLLPVNKEASLRSFSFGQSLLRRTALMAGVTATTIDRSGEREGIVGRQGLLAGLGVRITDVLRVTGGALLFGRVDPGTDDVTPDRAAFVSVSLDWDVRQTMGGLFDALFD